jgi:hypothetical protein
MRHLRLKQTAIAAAAAVLALSLAACNGTDGEKGTGSSKPSAPAATATKKPASKKAAPKAPAKTPAQQFAAYVGQHGTTQEKTAARHVTKIQGADDLNNIADQASVYTDYTGGLGAESGHARLLTGSFKDWEAARGKTSKNGLVTVYNASGDTIGNGQF